MCVQTFGRLLEQIENAVGGALFTVTPDPGTLSPWTGFAVLCAWTAAALLGALVLLRRRDA
ncbi:MAG: hypothetical protein ACXVXO_15510 [Mycobacteriaceae bacterium]